MKLLANKDKNNLVGARRGGYSLSQILAPKPKRKKAQLIDLHFSLFNPTKKGCI